jgi:6-phosphogluconolactonase
MQRCFAISLREQGGDATRIAIMSGLRNVSAESQLNQMNYFLYVGVYGEGIYAYRYDASGANLEPLGLLGEVVNPSFLATDRASRFLYAVSELEGKVDGGVAAFAIDRTSGGLRSLNTVSSAGQAPCHLTVDHTMKMVVVANYGTGSVSAFPLETDGRLGQISALMTAHGSSVNPKRQEGPHAHEAVISVDNRFVYVPDLGLDQIRMYRLDPANAKLTPNDPPFVKTEPGVGPRHIVLSSNRRFAYVANELKPVVTVFKRDPENGSLEQIQSLSTSTAGSTGENAHAAIEIHPDGKFLYVSSRGPGTLTVFTIDPDGGTLEQIQVAETGGTWPRGFRIDPTGRLLFAGDQRANRFVILEIDQASGKLSLTDRVFQVPSPVDFLFVPAE